MKPDITEQAKQIPRNIHDIHHFQNISQPHIHRFSRTNKCDTQPVKGYNTTDKGYMLFLTISDIIIRIR